MRKSVAKDQSAGGVQEEKKSQGKPETPNEQDHPLTRERILCEKERELAGSLGSGQKNEGDTLIKKNLPS